MDGLDKFREAFAEYSDNYVIIGGTACEINMSGTEVSPRATHDIDMIVVVERMTEAFCKRFWDFAGEAGYRPARRKTDDGGRRRYELYRFINGKPGYPAVIELLSKHQDFMGVPEGLRIEPLAVEESISSLSAIIMEDDYYQYTIEHSILTDGIRLADPAALVALKTHAYLNLLNDKRMGTHVDERNIRKHRTDALKCVLILPDEEIAAPASIVGRIGEFAASIREDWDTLEQSLTGALGTNAKVVEQLLTRMTELFVEKQ